MLITKPLNVSSTNFLQDMASQEFRVQEVNEQADKLMNEGHPETETINTRKEASYLNPLN